LQPPNALGCAWGVGSEIDSGTRGRGSRSRFFFGSPTLALLRLPFFTPACDADSRFPALLARPLC